MNNQLDFFYGKESEQFNFVRVPKLLFRDERFKGLSSDSKLLYALLLDRMALSLKNGWVDDENRVYIYFTIKEVMEELNMAREKCTKVFAELDSEKGCGLIFRVKQGLGRPDIIYVMNFLSCLSEDGNEEDIDMNYESEGYEEDETSASNSQTSRVSKIEIQGFRKSKLKDFGNRNSRVSEIKTLEFRKSKANDNEFNNNKNNYTDVSNIHHITSYQQDETSKKRDVIDEIREREEYKELISENIEYDFLVKNYSQSAAEEILETMLDAVCSNKDYIWIGEEMIPQMVVKSRLLKLNYGHIVYVLDSIKRNKTNVRNPKKYLLATLYNAITSMDTYYTTAVNYDLYGNK